MNPYGIPEINAIELAARLNQPGDLLLIDVREAQELQLANLDYETVHLPLSDLARRTFEAIPAIMADDREKEMVIICHHGIRSAQVCAFLLANGWTNVINLAGGIDAFARQVDPSIGFY